METIYQLAICDEESRIIYLGCCYKSLSKLKNSVYGTPDWENRHLSTLQDSIEDVRGSWPATIETDGSTILKTTFFPLFAYRRRFDPKEQVKGYIEHQLY